MSARTSFNEQRSGNPTAFARRRWTHDEPGARRGLSPALARGGRDDRRRDDGPDRPHGRERGPADHPRGARRHRHRAGVGDLGLHARVRGDPDRRGRLRRPTRAQARVPRRDRRVRPGEPGRRARPGARRADRGPRCAGRCGGRDDPPGARELPDDVLRRGAWQGVRYVRRDPRLRLRARARDRRRADDRRRLRPLVAGGVPDQRPDRGGFADRVAARGARDQRPAGGAARRRRWRACSPPR